MLIKLIWLGLFLSGNHAGGKIDIMRVRSLYLNAATSETVCRELLEVTSAGAGQSNPLLAGYHGAAMMIMAKYYINPFRKLKWYSEGKELLEKALLEMGGSPELHFIRYSIQVASPPFLGYRRDLAKDRVSLEKFASLGGNDQLSTIVRGFLNKTKRNER